jgi:hypothetical protein
MQTEIEMQQLRGAGSARDRERRVDQPDGRFPLPAPSRAGASCSRV